MKLKLLLIPLLGSSLLLSACSSATSQVISSLSSAQKYFEANKGELNKKNVINILKDGYNSDPNKTVNALLAGWKYTLMDQKLLERNLDASRFASAFGSTSKKDDITPNISEKSLFLADTFPGISSEIAKVFKVEKQTVSGFSYSWNSPKKFQVNIQIKMDGKIDESSKALIKSFLEGNSSGGKGSNGKNSIDESEYTGEKAKFTGNFIFTYTPPTGGARNFSDKSFDVPTSSINFPANVKIDVTTSHTKLNELLESNEQVKKMKSRQLTGKLFNLLPFFTTLCFNSFSPFTVFAVIFTIV
ncbi:lipoprotein [Mycoplasmoides pneumoniae]|uniref:Uncharacterized lipoprotein MG439 homolog 5 n=3 Tax=Mycoplasmoides pneumoniae TaxID=2104 RepID=Y640_MYCPN|nr:MPN647 family lipoprotein [Mycoplasmoides pneumoniae]P75157.1 RecName: Full=Uncharacterized lipoprotein MG439 homolog 5; Flags: Precursor [Mycoplasmoides pneumoniae M129]AAB95850.1 conserved hypothetical protein [Mycoplasmoides pneumoniae M129]AGC04509.1 hypothetical protein C985_0643 [Mycoplasmoides pneumoniae M129-B7]ALA30505.1 hypothetical protein C897_03610 [Mycoplasmoides pneumoniae PI 1428]ALA32611.1 hypothetical protein F533_03610 [Mycoplasmoides pneumoniae 51494]ALA33312.1 hypothet